MATDVPTYSPLPSDHGRRSSALDLAPALERLSRPPPRPVHSPVFGAVPHPTDAVPLSCSRHAPKAVRLRCCKRAASQSSK
jgi:hypothetical protein